MKVPELCKFNLGSGCFAVNDILPLEAIFALSYL